MKKNMYCFYCDKIVNTKTTIKENTYIVHKTEIKINEEITICKNCGSELINDNLNNSLYEIYNEYLKLNGLSFEKLKEIRKSLNLSQDLFSTGLGWSKKTVIRYETAKSLPQTEYLSVYKKLSNNKNEFINILNNNKDKIDTKTYYDILNKVEVELNPKTINTFLYILDKNPLSKTQIMKNLFAVDFESFKERKTPITKLQYAHGPYGPVIDKKDAYLNLLIKQDILELIIDEEDKSLFKPKQKYDLNLFSKEEITIMNKVKKQLKEKNSKELSDWSHHFKGWINTKNGENISFKYAENFELYENWN